MITIVMKYPITPIVTLSISNIIGQMIDKSV
jgi:hypothetical protein